MHNDTVDMSSGKRRRLTTNPPDLDTFAAMLSRGGPGPAPPKGDHRVAPASHRVTIEQTFPEGEAQGGWKPVPFTRDKWTSCFGCEYGLVRPDESQPALKGLWDLFRDNFCREMPSEALARLMKEYFDTEIRQPMLARGVECPDWTAEQIEIHIECHLMDPAVTAGVQLMNMKYVERQLLQEIRLRHEESGDNKIDLKILKSLMELQKHTQSLYNAKPARQLFYSRFLKLAQDQQT